MSRILVTGSTEGLGRAAASALLDEGHDVVIHARSAARLQSAQDLLDRGADSVVGDLGVLEAMLSVAEQANALGPFDAVIHNAGVGSGPALLPVNVVAPYVLTAKIATPARLVYISSGMHRGGTADLAGADWAGREATHTYSDTKLFLTTMMAAVARRWPDTIAHAVCPGWVRTNMGGPGASEDLDLGQRTQTWLATSDDPSVLVSGGYWHHQQLEDPHAAVHDTRFQDELLESLAAHTGVELAPARPSAL